MQDSFLDGNGIIEAAIDAYRHDSTKETLIGELESIRQRMHANGHLMISQANPQLCLSSNPIPLSHFFSNARV